MNKKLVNRVLSLALSMALALTSFVPVHAEEGLADLADDSAVEASLETSVVEETTEADTEEVTADDEQKDEGEEVAAEPETSDEEEASEEAGEASGVTDEEEELVSDGPNETVCTISFHLNGGEFDEADAALYVHEDGDYAAYGVSDLDDPTLVLKAAKKDGATFKGWYTTEDFSDNAFVYNEGEGTYTWEFGLDERMDVYAKFEAVSHATFNFYGEGADGEDPICSVDVEGKLNSETGKYDFTVPSKDGEGNDIVATPEDYFIFNGWYSSKDADIHAPEDVEYITLGETVLSAEEAKPEAFNIYGQWQDKAVVVKVDVPVSAGEFKVIAGIGNGQTVPVYHLGDTLIIGTTEYG
ncbi:MAG: InlB B-repeat-containing protein, partial [Butyrivibrio sp.]|nr:InlB B-repeat-containing protein [Butyrivibrio sp.]